MDLGGMVRKSFIVVLLAAGLLAGGAAAAQEIQDGREPPVIQANNAFGVKLFRQLAGDAAGKNVFYSPSSVAAALQMALLGAGGSTREAMARAMELAGVPDGELKAVRSDAAQTTGVTLETANSMWINQRIKPRPEYLQDVTRRFDALATSLNMADPGAADRVNGWVAGKTHDKIQKLVGPLSEATALLLVNAVYFKGKWQHVFDAQQTKDAPFHLSGGGERTVRMMEQARKFPYKRGDGFQAVKLPYGAGRVEMVVVLPDAADGLDAWIKGLEGERWKSLFDGFASRQGRIALPRFKIEYETKLNDPLKALGMTEAFAPGRADFSRMITPPPGAFISEVKHKAFVEVNEEGTEAAAATSVQMELTMAMPAEPFNMAVDHPFLCVIRDNQSGEVLFMGAIAQP